MKKGGKIALVCDWLTTPGGAEKVLLKLHEMYPEAPIYTSQYRPRKIDWFKDATVKTGWLNWLPASLRKVLGPLRAVYFGRLDLTEYDLVISVTGAEAKAVKAKRHICYCHVPTQYYWQMHDRYLENPGFGVLNPVVRLGFRLLVRPLRKNDQRSAQKPTEFVTISSYAKEQITKYYGREATVVAPPVEVERFSTDARGVLHKNGKVLHKDGGVLHKFSTGFPQDEEEFSTGETGFVIACRQVNWKRVDLAIEACLAAGKTLTVIGDGPEHKRLVKLANGSPLIKFVPWIETEKLAKYYREAEAYVFPSLEPFGIAAVEALAAGCPVIAYREGGSQDFVTEGENGVFFEEQTADSLAKAIKKCGKCQFRRDLIKKSVEKFAAKEFERKMRKICMQSAERSEKA